MPRKRLHIPLRVLLNNQLVGVLVKELGGAISFRYDENWLGGGKAIPVSLSLPLREEPYKEFQRHSWVRWELPSHATL